MNIERQLNKQVGTENYIVDVIRIIANNTKIEDRLLRMLQYE